MAPDGKIGIAYSSPTIWNDGVRFIEKQGSGGGWSQPALIQPTESHVRSFVYTSSGIGSILSQKNQNSQTLTLSMQQDPEWGHEIIEDSATGLGVRSALVYDQNGNPLVCFGIYVGKGKNKVHELTLTRWNPMTQSWEQEALDSASLFFDVTMAIGPNGPVIACKAREEAGDGSFTFELRHLEFDGAQWNIQRFGPRPDPYFNLVIAVNPVTGTSAIAYRDSVESGQFVHVLTQDSGNLWSEEVLSVSGFLRDFNFTPAGKPCVFAVDITPSASADRVLVWKTMGNWQKEIVLPVPTIGDAGMAGSLVMTAAGTPTIAFSLGSNPTILFAKRNGTID